jgi:hypothetical protein
MILKGKEYAKTGCWKEADAVFDEILSKPKTSTGKKIDVIMDKAKMALFSMVTKSLCNLFSLITRPVMYIVLVYTEYQRFERTTRNCDKA